MKVRADSLFSKLKPRQRELLFEWLIIEGILLTVARDRCEAEFGIKPSLAALSNFYARHGFSWRVEQAKAAAANADAKLPADIDDQIRRRLKQRQFEFSLGELSLKELEALAAMDVDARMLALKERLDPEKVELQRRRVELLERQLAEGRKVSQDGTLTAEEKEKKMREILGMA